MKIRLPLRKPGPPRQRPPKLKLKASVARSRRAPIIEEEDFEQEPEPNMKLSHAFVVVLVLHVIAVAGVFAFNSIKARQADIFSAMKDEPAKAEAPAAPENAPASTGSLAAPEAIAASDAATLAKPESVSPAAQAPAPAAAAGTHEVKPGETLTKIAAEYGVPVADLQTANSTVDPKTMKPGTMLTIPVATRPKPEASIYKPLAIAPAKPDPAPAVAKPVAEKPAIAAPAAAGAAKDSGNVYVVVKGDNPWKIAKRLKVKYADLIALNDIKDPGRIQIGQKLKIPAAK